MITRDETIKMAREACDPGTVDAWKNDFWTITQEELERFAALVAAAEREACAKACDTEADQHASLDRNGRSRHLDDATVARTCAAAIRARSEK